MKRPHTFRRTACLFALAALAANAANAAQAADAQADACLLAELAAEPGFSGVALLRQQGRTRVAAQGQSGSQPLDVDSRLNIGSAGKMFTAVAVAQLVERQRLAWDAPVGRWVDGLTPAVAAVTLRQLLTHSGGLGNFFTPNHLQAMQAARSLEDLRRLAPDVEPAFAPGSRFQYANNGFLLLGLAAERASGQSFDAYLHEHVFTPAGMTATSLSAQAPRPAAQGFTRAPALEGGPRRAPPPGGMPPPEGGGRPPPPDGPLRPSAESQLPGSSAGGAFSTVGDLLRFFEALRAGRLVQQETLHELTRRQIEAMPGQLYGLGFGIPQWEGHIGFGHNGGAPGVNAEALVFPTDDVTLVVLSNGDPPSASEQMKKLRRGALAGTLCAMPG